jgi:hypothetical protein
VSSGSSNCVRDVSCVLSLVMRSIDIPFFAQMCDYSIVA